MAGAANFSGIMGETFSLIGNGLRDIALFVVVVGIVNAIGPMFGLASPSEHLVGFDYSVTGEYGALGALYQLAALIFSGVAGYYLMIRFLHQRGRPAQGAAGILPYIGMTIISTIAVVLGLILLLIPGIYIWVRWSASTGFLISGGASITDSLSASWRATKGSGWPIFLVTLVLVIGLLAMGGALGAVTLITSETVTLVLSGFAEAGASALMSALAIAIYLLVSTDQSSVEDIFS